MKHIHFSKIFACLFSVIFVVVLCSCKHEMNNSSDENPSPTLTLVPTPSDASSSDADISSETSTPSGSVTSPETVMLSEISPMSMYKSVLLNNAEFFSIDYKKNMNITQLTAAFNGDVIKIIKFTVIDLDHDGMPEVILWKSLNENMNGGFEVLRYHDAVVYNYNFTYRNLLNLKTDGTHKVSGGAMDYGIGTVSFTDDYWMIDRIASCESSYDADNNLSDSYFVNHESATEEEFLSVVDKQNEKADVVWYDFTDDNIDMILAHTSIAPTSNTGAGELSSLVTAHNSIAMSAYKDVLLYNTTFFSTDNNKSMTLNQSLSAFFDYMDTMTISDFAIIDLDNDDTSEVILSLNIGVEILHYQDGSIYGYDLVERAFMDIKSDGSFSFSSGSADNGFGTISFTNTGYKINEIAYSKSSIDSNGNVNVSYYINQKSVTMDEFDEAVNQEKEMPNVIWYNYTNSNIETQFSTSN